MSRCGNCDLYWWAGKENFGVTCHGDCSAEECAENLQDLVDHLRNELKKYEKEGSKREES